MSFIILVSVLCLGIYLDDDPAAHDIYLGVAVKTVFSHPLVVETLTDACDSAFKFMTFSSQYKGTCTF